MFTALRHLLLWLRESWSGMATPRKKTLGDAQVRATSDCSLRLSLTTHQVFINTVTLAPPVDTDDKTPPVNANDETETLAPPVDTDDSAEALAAPVDTEPSGGRVTHPDGLIFTGRITAIRRLVRVGI